MYSSLSVAKHILTLAEQNNEVLTPMQLVKLVYLAHCWMLGAYRKPLIKDDAEAWRYGAVIPKLYRAIKQYRSHPVEKIECDEATFDEYSQDIIEQVYNKYGKLSGITLSKITGGKNSPWDSTWKDGYTIISNDLIRHHYEKLLVNV